MVVLAERAGQTVTAEAILVISFHEESASVAVNIELDQRDTVKRQLGDLHLCDAIHSSMHPSWPRRHAGNPLPNAVSSLVVSSLEFRGRLATV